MKKRREIQVEGKSDKVTSLCCSTRTGVQVTHTELSSFCRFRSLGTTPQGATMTCVQLATYWSGKWLCLFMIMWLDFWAKSLVPASALYWLSVFPFQFEGRLDRCLSQWLSSHPSVPRYFCNWLMMHWLLALVFCAGWSHEDLVWGANHVHHFDQGLCLAECVGSLEGDHRAI